MDVRAEMMIEAPPDAVAKVMFDPANDPRWIGGARSVEALEPVAVGAKVRRAGGFMGRSFSWVTEVTDYDPNRRLAMRFIQGPLKGTVSYEIQAVSGGSHVTVRNAGDSSFSFPGMSWMVRRGVMADLKRLKTLVEAPTAPGDHP